MTIGYLASAVESARAVPLLRTLRVMERLSPRDRQGFARGVSAWADEVRDW